jgi:hypothetical protein
VFERVVFGIAISTVGAILIRIGMKMAFFFEVEENKEVRNCPGPRGRMTQTLESLDQPSRHPICPMIRHYV